MNLIKWIYVVTSNVIEGEEHGPSNWISETKYVFPLPTDIFAFSLVLLQAASHADLNA